METSPSKITSQTFTHLLSLYPRIIERAYRDKLRPSSIKKKNAKSKSGNDQNNNSKEIDEKVREFLELDTWRYDVLPARVREREERFLSKEEVEGLMGWKL